MSNKIYRELLNRSASIFKAMDFLTFEEPLGEEFRDAWALDTFIDENGTYILFSSRGKLYRTYVSVSDREFGFTEPEEIVIEHVPVESRTKIFRTDSGKLRFISIASASVLNRQGEIDTKDLYDSMVDNWDEFDGRRNLNFYHFQQDEFVMGEVKGISRYNEFLIAWGEIDETTEIGRGSEDVLSEEGWGLSIEFAPLKREIENIGGVDIKKYTRGIFVGLAVLKEEHAASYFTNINI